MKSILYVREEWYMDWQNVNWNRDISCIIVNHCSMEKLNTLWKIMIAVINVQN